MNYQLMQAIKEIEAVEQEHHNSYLLACDYNKLLEEIMPPQSHKFFRISYKYGMLYQNDTQISHMDALKSKETLINFAKMLEICSKKGIYIGVVSHEVNI